MPSAVEFTRNFNRVMFDVGQATSPDVRVELLAHLWPDLDSVRTQPQFSSYIEEYKAAIRLVITQSATFNLGLAELTILSAALRALDATLELSIVVHEQAKLHAYVGDLDAAVSLVAEHVGEKLDTLPHAEIASGTSEIRLLERTISAAERTAPKTADVLKRLHTEWQLETSALHHDKIWCLLIQSGSHLTKSRGSLLELSGQIDVTNTMAKREDHHFNDRVALGNQLKAPDDPAVGGVYRALASVRDLLDNQSLARPARARSWSVQYQLADTDNLLTGDSLSLGAGLVAYACILDTEVLRHERLISGEVGFTGNLDEKGHLMPVNGHTLRLKVERAFFSHLKYLVIPAANRSDAEAELGELTAKYPCRRFHLIAAETLAEVAENHNVVRPEKLCPGVYAGKIAKKYTRSTAVQIPLLIILSYILLSVVYPPLWFWFDDNPVSVRLSKDGNRLDVENSSAYILWHIDYKIDSAEFMSECWRAVDLDGDGKNEVLLVMMKSSVRPDSTSAQLYTFDDDGRLLWRQSCLQAGEYIESSTGEPYATYVYVLRTGNSPLILTRAYKSYPAREHIKVWSGAGNLLGWYINQGVAAIGPALDVDGDGRLDITLHGYNNRLQRAILCVLPDSGFSGVSPPYSDSAIDLAWVKHGTQKQYIVFRPTDVTEVSASNPYSYAGSLAAAGDGKLLMSVWEPRNTETGIDYIIDSSLRVQSAMGNDDFIKRRKLLIKASAIPDIPLNEYLRERLDSVAYWTDSGWVTEAQLGSR